MTAPNPALDQQLARDLEEAARRHPRGTLRILAALFAYLLVAAVGGHNPIADRYLTAIGAALAPLVTFGLGVMVPNPFSRP